MEPVPIDQAKPSGKRPIAVTILAVLNLFFGSVGVLMAPLSLLAVLTAAPTDGQQAPIGAPNPQSLSFLWLVSSYCTSVLVLAAGIGLLKMKSWSWWMSVGCAAYALGFFLLSRVLLVLLSLGAPAHRESYLAALVVGTAMLCLPMLLHPVIAFFVLLPDPVRRQFARAPSSNAQSNAPRDFAPSAEPRVVSSSPSLMRWLMHGPSLPPYQARRPNGLDAGWQWAILLAPTSFGLLLLLTVFAFASFRTADVPNVFMGTLAVITGSVMLAGALFEWRWFFENRSARGLRYWAGDSGARWFYIITSGILLLLGFRLVGHAAMPTMAGKHPFFRMTDGTEAAASFPSTPGRFLGEHSALLGGRGGSPFERFDANYRPLVGIRYELGNWGGQQVLAKIEPIFDHATTGEGVVIPRDGYQVGGLQVDSREFVNAVRLIFVPVDATKDDQADLYMSDWIGQPISPGTPQQLGGDDRTPVGIFGRQGIITDAIGLLYKPRDE